MGWQNNLGYLTAHSHLIAGSSWLAAIKSFKLIALSYKEFISQNTQKDLKKTARG